MGNTLEEELQEYIDDSRFHSSIEDLKKALPYQAHRKSFPKNVGAPLPEMHELQAMSNKLGKLYAASVKTTANTKVSV